MKLEKTRTSCSSSFLYRIGRSRLHTSSCRLDIGEVAGDVGIADVGSSTNVDHRLDIEAGRDVKLSRADINQGDKGAGKQGGDIVCKE